MRCIYSMGTNSSSQTYGNVASCIKEFILNNFPKGYFKYKHISTQLVSAELKKDTENTANTNVPIQEKPALIIKPTFDLTNKDYFLSDTLMTTNLNNVESGISRRNLFPVIKDMEHELELKFKMNRDRIVFDVTIIIGTQHNQLDTFKHIQNHLAWNNPFHINTSLETIIPRPMVDYLGKINNIDIDKSANINILLKYMNDHACYPITYKMRNSTSKDEFFIYYNVNLLTTLSNLSLDDGNVKGMTSKDFKIAFTITTDFNTPGNYYIIGDPAKKPTDIMIDAIIQNNNFNDSVPIFTAKDIFNTNIIKDTNFSLYQTIIVKTEEERSNESDNIDLHDKIESEIQNLATFHLNNNIPINTFVKILVLKDREWQTETTEWIMDWNLVNLTFFNTDPHATYRVMIFCNMGYIHEKTLKAIPENRYDNGIPSN